MVTFNQELAGLTPQLPGRRASRLVDQQPNEGPEHGVVFYEDDQFLVDSLADFIGSAIGSHQRAVVAATPDHRAAVENRLDSLGIDVSAARDAGVYRDHDARESLERILVGSWPRPEPFRMWLDEMLDGVTAKRPARIFGELVALLLADGLPEAALALEDLWNRELATRPFSLLCGYPMGAFAGEALAPALDSTCRAHRSIVPSESYSALTGRHDQLREITVLQQKAQSLESALLAEQQARQAAERALRVRDEFLSSAAHELRTPITVLGLQAQSALRRWDHTGQIEPDRAVRALRTIEFQSYKLARLVNQLLDVSRLDSGKLAVEPQPVDLAGLVRQVVEVMQDVSALHPVSAVALEPVTAQADPLRIEQVLMNLIDNSIKYSPEGSSIEVSLMRVDAGFVELAVRDFGPGIALAKREHIFDRFFQTERENSRWGIGLGLYLCRKIVEMHGGELSASWPSDGGTRLSLRLPT